MPWLQQFLNGGMQTIRCVRQQRLQSRQLLSLWWQQQQVDRQYSSSPFLQDVLKMQLLHGKTAEEVEEIWMAHHDASDRHVGIVLSRDEHAVLTARAGASPLFVLPLQKPRGFCTLMMQWQQQQQQLLVTTLDEFKQHGSAAPPHFVMTLYHELADSHALVLARGDVLNSQLISKAEGRTVMELTRAFYTDPASYQLVYAFNHKPDSFDFQRLLNELRIQK